MKDLKVFTNNIEEEALKQIELLLEQEPFKNCKVRIMPDVHAGKGCVIGFTANLGDKVIPNIVGVDIGCGMLTVDLGQIDIDLEKLDNVINKVVPSGKSIHDNKVASMEEIADLYCLRDLTRTKKFDKAIGTLGGGNHFIEVGIDDENNKYLIIHSGSRNMGNQVAQHYQNFAIQLCSGKEDMFEKKDKIIKEYKEQGRRDEIQKALKELEKEYSQKKPNLPEDLCYLEGKYRDMYLHDMEICQKYASLNRKVMVQRICGEMFGNSVDVNNSFETIHNYIDLENNIVRKGAISAKKGERVLIPINMRDGCIIGVGKGNKDWNESAPHGAGRLMSRTKARETFELDEFKKSMAGIYTTSVNQSTIDEAPMVYKPMQEIIDNIGDTVNIERIIKPIYNFKARN
ncbi:MAG: RtcB family protein [Oscillospiraceae bacterium]|nr:RtcB family protein [Oscillospiraceae bacterium]